LIFRVARSTFSLRTLTHSTFLPDRSILPRDSQPSALLFKNIYDILENSHCAFGTGFLGRMIDFTRTLCVFSTIYYILYKNSLPVFSLRLF
jgi:hypothetical protein